MKLPFAGYIKSHHISHAALSAAAITAALVFFVVGAGLRLLWGPVSLGPLRGTLAGAIHDALPGINLDYDQAALEWSRDQGRVNLVVLGARISDSQNRVVASAPKAAIGLAAAPFLQGHFVVKRITLVGVEFTLVHTKSGQIRLGAQTGNDDIIGRISDVIDARSSESSALESFAVRDARLTILDDVTGLHVQARRADLMLRARGSAIGVTFDADVAMSGKVGHVTADLTLPPEKGPVKGRLNVKGLDLRALGANATMFAGVARVPLVVNATTNFTVNPGGRLAVADFDVAASGTIPWAAMASKSLPVKNLKLTGRYDGATRRLTLTSADLMAQGVHAALKGFGDFVYAGERLDHVHAQLSGHNIAVDLPGIYAAPVTYRSLDLAGDYLIGPRQFVIAKFAAAADGGFALSASGKVTLNDAGAPGLVSKAHIGALPVHTLLRYWPLPVAPGAREWAAANIFAGTVGPLDAQTDFAPGMLDQEILPEASLNLTFAMRDIEGSYVNGLTHATGVSGTAILTGDTFKADFSSGRVGALTLSQGTALIPALHRTGTVGQFGVHVDGAMPDVMTLIDMKPLNYPTRFGIDPKTTAGVASADLTFGVPMLANLPVDDVAISVKADVENFAISLSSRTRITQGKVHFDIDNHHLHQTGQVNLADTRLNVDWTEDFTTDNPVTTRLGVKGVMTEAGRHALNINLDRYFRGAVPITAEMTGHRGSLLHADVAVDFTPAALSVPIVNLEKLPGQSASGRIGVNFAPGNMVRSQTIHITGPVLNLSGTANFDRNGALTVLNFPSVRMGPLNDLSFQLIHNAGSDEYVLRGHSLDGSKIGRNGSNEAPAAAAAADEDSAPSHYRINARLDRMAMRDGVAIAPFNLDLSGIGNRPSALGMSGALMQAGKSAPIAATLENRPDGRKVTLTSGDAGMLARGLFAFESMRGGALSATVNLPGRASDPVNSNNPAPDFTGTLTVKNFTIIHQPMLARLFSAGSLTGLGDLMGGDGMSLEELTLPFTSKNNVISVNGARAVGRAIGASADGYIDRPRGTLALKGSLIPAYGINSLISNVPLIGDILASKKGEGIFGVTYSASGDSEHPTISTNVLSMLTPGILRRIFEGHIPTAANAPSNMAASPHEDTPAGPPPPPPAAPPPSAPASPQ